MFYFHQLLARKAPLGQIWMAATLHAKINRKKLDKLDIIQICEEILNPSVPMALRLSGILMGGVVIVYGRKVKILFDDDGTRHLLEINRAWPTKTVPDPTLLLPKGKTHARKEAVTLPENQEADFGDAEQTRSLPKLPNFMELQQTYISMRLDEPNVNDNPEQEDLGQQFHQADADNITLFEYHGSYQANTETYDRFERFDIEGDDETQMNFSAREGAQIPTTLIPSPPLHHDIPEGGNPTNTQRQEQQEHVRNIFPEQMEEQNIPDREEHDRPQAAKRRRKTATLKMDYEQNIIAGLEYQSWLQDTSNILMSGKKRKTRGTITLSMEISERMKMPPTQLFEEHVDISYPPQLQELWSKSTQLLQTSSPETRRPDFCAEQSPGSVQERMHNHHQTDHFQGNETSPQDLGSPAERLRDALAGKDVSIESLVGGTRARPGSSNRQTADINVTPFYSGDDVRSMPRTPSARGAASINTEINSNRPNRKRPHSSPRRGLEPVAEEQRGYDFEFSMIPEKGFTADNQVLVETGPTQTQKPATTHSEEKITDSIKSHLKTHFKTPGTAQVESLNKLASGMKRNAAAQLFYQSCVLATGGMIKVNQSQPYGDILIGRGPSMDESNEKTGGFDASASAIGDFAYSQKSPLSPEKEWEPKEKYINSNQGDKGSMYTIGQKLRIRVGPLKGYLCRVIALRYSDVTVKLDSQHKILTVKSEDLAEVLDENTMTRSVWGSKPTSDVLATAAIEDKAAWKSCHVSVGGSKGEASFRGKQGASTSNFASGKHGRTDGNPNRDDAHMGQQKYPFNQGGGNDETDDWTLLRPTRRPAIPRDRNSAQAFIDMQTVVFRHDADLSQLKINLDDMVRVEMEKKKKKLEEGQYFYAAPIIAYNLRGDPMSAMLYERLSALGILVKRFAERKAYCRREECKPPSEKTKLLEIEMVEDIFFGAGVIQVENLQSGMLIISKDRVFENSIVSTLQDARIHTFTGIPEGMREDPMRVPL